MFVTLCKL